MHSDGLTGDWLASDSSDADKAIQAVYRRWWYLNSVDGRVADQLWIFGGWHNVDFTDEMAQKYSLTPDPGPGVGLPESVSSPTDPPKSLRLPGPGVRPRQTIGKGH